MNLLPPRGLCALLLCLSCVASAGAPDKEVPLQRIAFGSCAGQDAPQPIWNAVLDARPDLWIWAGDNIYGDTEDMGKLAADWQTLLAQPGYRALRGRGIPILGTWDDHDFGANDAGASYPQRAASQQLFLDFLGVPADSPRRRRAGVYHAQSFGPPGRRVQVILLDTRYHRSELQSYPRDSTGGRRVYRPVRDEAATILGEAQWQWLAEQLREPARLRLIVSSIQVLSSEHVYEKWANFPRERRRLLELLEDSGVEGVLLLSGDRHHAELSRLDSRGAYPLYELTSSGLNKSRPRPAGARRPPEPNRLRLAGPYRGHHYGLLEIDWEQPDPLIRLSIRDVENRAPIAASLRLSEISPAAASRAAGRDYSELSGDGVVPAGAIVLDGHTDDWTGPDLIAQGPRHLFLRIPVPRARSLHRGGTSLRVLLDLDGPARGSPGPRDRGIDLEIVFAPPREEGTRVWGPQLLAYGPGPVALEAASVGLQAAPTHAARWFELRLDRAALGELAAPSPGGAIELRVYEDDAATGTQRLLARESVPVAAPAPAPAAAAAADLPAKPAGALRVVSYNLLWGSQLSEPAPFARLFRALDADLFLLQEWSRERIAEGEVLKWFRTHVDETADWHAAVAGDAGWWHGTLVVAPYPIDGRLPRYTPLDAGGWSFPLRVAGGLVQTPLGSLLAASVHLKAAGHLGSAEDQRRLAEAEALNRLLVGMRAAAAPDFVVLGGDFNLNGTPAVLQRSLRMLDADGSALSPARPAVTGDPALLSTFGRGLPQSRLDYLAYSDHSLRAAAAFIVDTRQLPEAVRRRHGLRPDDSEASDHRPLVVDLLRR